MISVAGASLIATVYPLGALFLLIDGRSFLTTKGWAGVLRAFKVGAIIVTGIALVLVTGSVAICVSAVNAGTPIEGLSGVMVVTAGWALTVAVAGCVGELFAKSFLEQKAER